MLVDVAVVAVIGVHLPLILTGGQLVVLLGVQGLVVSLIQTQPTACMQLD